MKTIYEAKTLSEVITFLKQSENLSNDALGRKIGISKSGVFYIEQGGRKHDAKTVDKIAAYAGVSREWLYEITFGIKTRPTYGKIANAVAGMVDKLPPTLQAMILAQTRTAVELTKRAADEGDSEKQKGEE